MSARRVTGTRRAARRDDAERAAVAARVAAIVGPGAVTGSVAPPPTEDRYASDGGSRSDVAGAAGVRSSGLGGWVPPPPAPVEAPSTVGDADGPAASLGVFPDDLEPARRPWRERLRLDPGRRGVLAVAAVVVVVGSVAGGVVVGTGPSSPDLTIATVGSGSAGSSASSGSAPASPDPAAGSPGAAATGAATVTVDVTGRVTHPGVVRLPVGARVQDALDAVGGALPGTDLSGLNRARVLVDGEQVAVGVAGAAPAAVPTGAAPATAGAAGGPVDLNTADLTRLESLPGVGPVLGQAILDWRTEHGRFTAVDQLQDVTGIGPSRFAQLRELVTV